MNTRDQFRASLAIDTLRRFLNNPDRVLIPDHCDAIRILIEIAEAAATPPKPETNVTNFYREF